MTLKQLEAFYWAATLGTFAIAAQRLHVTQSSLSKRIAELESDLGQPLFDRSTRRATLTAAGEALLTKASSMLELEREIRADCGQSDHELRGVCRVGITELAAMTWFPALAAHIASDQPLLTLEPQVGLSRPLAAAVIRGELDIATVAGSAEHPTLHSQTIAELDFVWTASPSRLPPGAVLAPGDFETHPVINNPQDSGLSAAFDAWARTNGIHIGKTISCNSRSAIIALTVAGVGISFQPLRYVQPLVDKGILMVVACDPPLPRQTYSLVWRVDDDRRLVGMMVDLIRVKANFELGNMFWEP